MVCRVFFFAIFFPFFFFAGIRLAVIWDDVAGKKGVGGSVVDPRWSRVP